MRNRSLLSSRTYVQPVLSTPPQQPTRLPWKLVPNHLHAAVLDADENTLFIASTGIAEQVLAAVNAHLGLISKSAELELGLRCLHGSLHEIDRKTPNVRKMITMAQHALGMANGCDND